MRDSEGIHDENGTTLLDAKMKGGVLDGVVVSGLVLDETSWGEDRTSVLIAVENQTGRYEAVGVVGEWPSQEPSYEDSARFAAAMARTWHVEEYRFDKMIRTRLTAAKSAQWTFCGGYELRVTRKQSRCVVEVGQSLELSTDGRAVVGGPSRWRGVADEVDRACDAFVRLASLVVSDSGVALTGPLEAVAEHRERAHRLAAMGAELEHVVDPGDKLDTTIDEVADQLEAVRASVIDAVRVISQVQLSLPSIFPNDAIVGGELDLAALAAGVDEMKVREAER